MVTRRSLLAAFSFALATACHEGDERGVGSIAPDRLLGCWRGAAGERVMVTSTNYAGPPLDEGQEWARETEILISVSDPTTGAKTIQTDFDDDSHLRLSYTAMGGQLRVLALTRVDPDDSGACP